MGDAPSSPTRCDFPQPISPATLVPTRLAPYQPLPACVRALQAGPVAFARGGHRGMRPWGTAKGRQLLLASHPAAPNSGQGCAVSGDASARVFV